MALKEEFEYLSFRCCYCHAFNPSLKKRPTPPQLDQSMQPSAISDTSESEKNSGSDSDQEMLNNKTKLEVETLYSKDQQKHSDNEPVSDFDKLSDIDVKLSDTDVMDNETHKLDEKSSDEQQQPHES